VHRIEKPRHQRQPLALSFLVMIEDVLRHAVPDRERLALRAVMRSLGS
jgi:hypothetical protein